MRKRIRLCHPIIVFVRMTKPAHTTCTKTLSCYLDIRFWLVGALRSASDANQVTGKKNRANHLWLTDRYVFHEKHLLPKKNVIKHPAFTMKGLSRAKGSLSGLFGFFFGDFVLDSADDNATRAIAKNVNGRAAHIENTVDSKNETNSFYREMNGL